METKEMKIGIYNTETGKVDTIALPNQVIAVANQEITNNNNQHKIEGSHIIGVICLVALCVAAFFALAKLK